MTKTENRFLKAHKQQIQKGVVSVPDYICKKINAMPRGADNEYIINLPNHTAYKRLQKICETNGLPKIRFHDLRHANASIMLLLGTPQKYATERGGWSSLQTMEIIYQHTFDTEKKQVDNNINNFLSKLLKK